MPSAKHSNDIEIDVATQEGHRASRSKGLCADVGSADACEMEICCGGGSQLFCDVACGNGKAAISNVAVGGDGFNSGCVHAAVGEQTADGGFCGAAQGVCRASVGHLFILIVVFLRRKSEGDRRGGLQLVDWCCHEVEGVSP